MIRDSFRQRRQVLRDNFQPVEGFFGLAKSLDTSETDEIGQFLDEAFKGKCAYCNAKATALCCTYLSSGCWLPCYYLGSDFG